MKLFSKSLAKEVILYLTNNNKVHLKNLNFNLKIVNEKLMLRLKRINRQKNNDRKANNNAKLQTVKLFLNEKAGS